MPTQKNMELQLPIRAVAYARFSSDLQRGESIDAQLSAIREFAERSGFVMVGEYIDRAKSATTDQRPSFLEMIADAEDGKFDILICHKLDRFSRSKYDSAIYKHRLKMCNVRLISVTENFDDSPESLILESVLEAMAEYYSRNLAREVMKGQLENAKSGRSTGGPPPFGFKLNKDTKRLEINESEAAGVELIFDMVLQGYSYHDIIIELNALGYKTRGGRSFGINSLYSLLRNEKYRGCYTFNKSAQKNVSGKRNGHKQKPLEEIIRIEGGCPRIISDENFFAVQKKMEQRQQPRGNANYKERYLLTGKVVCGNCGCSYVGSRRKRKDGSHWIYYGCNNRMRSKGTVCKNNEISRNYIESVVLEHIADTVFTDSIIPIVRQSYNEFIKDGKQSIHASELTRTKWRLTKLTNDIDELVEVLIQTKSKALCEKLEVMEAEKQELTVEVHRLSCQNEVKSATNADIKRAFADIRKKLKTGNLDNLRQLIELYVESITVFPDNVVIVYNFMPTVTLPLLNRGAATALAFNGTAQITVKNHPHLRVDDFGGEGGI